jgi:hypothetical protein
LCYKNDSCINHKNINGQRIMLSFKILNQNTISYILETMDDIIIDDKFVSMFSFSLTQYIEVSLFF